MGGAAVCLAAVLVLGCGGDDRGEGDPRDGGGSGGDSGPAGDVGPPVDTGPPVDGGPGVDAGPGFDGSLPGFDAGTAGANGDSCCEDSDCRSGFCLGQFMELGRRLPMRGGTCVSYCSVSTDCRDDEFCHQQTDDGAVVRGAYCLQRCTSDAECREGYHCGGWGDCFPSGGGSACGEAVELATVATVLPDGALRVVGCTTGHASLGAGSCGGGGAEVAYTYTPEASGTLTLTTRDPATRADHAVYVRRTCGDGGSELACDAAAGGATVTVPVSAGVAVSIFVDGNARTGPYGLVARFERGIECAAGTADCDRDPANGCEVTFTSDAANCGACGISCALPHASVSCTAGVCGFDGCEAGWTDCDMSTANGCEADTSTDESNCGACGTSCYRPRAMYACTAGTCAITGCDTDYENCDGDESNGCEQNTSFTPAHCGGCGRACSLPNAMPNCIGGTCTIYRCLSGYEDCDGLAANGCEVAILEDESNCGRCGTVCPAALNATPACRGGICFTECIAPYLSCTGAVEGCETDPRSDVRNCGRCGNFCPEGPASRAVCTDGACGLMCVASYRDCNADPADFCETDINSTVAHCGGCGRACPDPPNATPFCSSASCIFFCDGRFSDCDGNAANGCERDLNTDPANCGSCGSACRASQVCCTGTCATRC